MYDLRPLVLLSAGLVLNGCSQPIFGGLFERPAEEAAAEVPAPDTEEAAPIAPPPPVGATTAEEFDTTSAEDRAAALAEPVTQEQAILGRTSATLGDPADPGIWLKTPLVTEVAQGRVSWEGQEITVELRPSGGEPGSGSQISLAAMRLLGAPLTAIIEVDVTRL